MNLAILSIAIVNLMIVVLSFGLYILANKQINLIDKIIYLLETKPKLNLLETKLKLNEVENRV